MPKEKAVLKNHYLNEDLITIILLKLPVKSLARFKCVCKSWDSFINSLDHKDYIVSSYRFSGGLTFISYDTFEETTNEIAHDSDLVCCRVSMRGSSSGLLCLKAREDHYVINPATSKCHKIPTEPKLAFKRSLISYSYGFGFDPTTNDYKLVRVTIPLEAYVFSLRNNSWRLIRYQCKKQFLEGVLRISETWSRAVVKNVVHWCAILKEEVGYKPVGIARFDLVNNVFEGIIRIPPNLKYRESCDCVHRCCLVRNCLSVAALFEDDDSIELWVMNKYGVEGSWTKLYRLGFSHLLEHPCRWMSEFEIGFHGEVLIHEGWRLIFLRPVSGEDYEILFDRRNVLLDSVYVSYREYLNHDKRSKFLA